MLALVFAVKRAESDVVVVLVGQLVLRRVILVMVVLPTVEVAVQEALWLVAEQIMEAIAMDARLPVEHNVQ